VDPIFKSGVAARVEAHPFQSIGAGLLKGMSRFFLFDFPYWPSFEGSAPLPGNAVDVVSLRGSSATFLVFRLVLDFLLFLVHRPCSVTSCDMEGNPGSDRSKMCSL